MKNIQILLVLLLFTSTQSFLEASSFQEREAKAYSATSIESGVKELFGHSNMSEDIRVLINAPQVASNGGAVPVRVSTSIPAKTVALFQDANPNSLVAVWHVLENSIVEYDVKIKMQNSGMLRVVVEGKDGKLYTAHLGIEIALGGCDGSGGDSSYVSSSSSPHLKMSQARYIAKRAQSVNQPRFYTPKPKRNNESYSLINENNFKETQSSPLSTFSTDVDTASYANVRNYLLKRESLPPKDAVRVEEMINYFSYDYKQPEGKSPFYINAGVGKSLWNKNSEVIQIGIQTKKVDISKLPASNLVFLLDVSGSMFSEDKLPLLVKSLKLLVAELRQEDRVSIVVYAGNSGLVLDRAKGDDKKTIYAALDSLRAGGSTAGGAGINLAYEIAKKAFIYNGNNRVILATDGDFNVGVRDERELLALIEKKREENVFLSVLGFGTGNYKDDKMELLADKGNGNYNYIDTLLEAKKVLVTQMSGTLYTVAKDVKIQVEFNPARVHSYRLIGYENRLMANEDFNNDKKDAGEVGMGHRVTALYEIVLTSQDNEFQTDALKYQRSEPSNLDELATVKIRYKSSKEDTSKLISKTISADTNEISKDDFAFTQSVVGFAMLLRESQYVKDLNYKTLIKTAKDSKSKDRNGNRAEMIKMIEKAELLNTSR